MTVVGIIMDSIIKFMDEYQQALMSTNWDKLSSFFHDNCAMLYSDGTYIGKKALKKAFEKTFLLMKKGDFRISNIHCSIITDQFCTCLFKLSWSAEVCGDKIIGEDRGTCSLVVVDNSWQIINQHLGPVAK